MQFDFGKNWADFSANALTSARVRQAREDFAGLMALASIDLKGKSFLDIGFGQGLSLMSAFSMGAHVVGCDINPMCADVLARNRSHFPQVSQRAIPIVVGSILDSTTVEQLQLAAPGRAGYDLVHSWGVLHHTGDMRLALTNAAGLVGPGGHLVLALYNRHWSSPAWRLIKRAYCASPKVLRRLLVWALFPIIYFAKWLVTGENPLKQSRGMDFYYNVVDWVGGYPYEFASSAEVLAFIQPLGFRCIALVPSQVPTGCNEYVLQRG